MTVPIPTPTIKPKIVAFIPPTENVDPPVEAIQTGGFIDGMHKIYGKNYNHFWKQSFDVENYILSPQRLIFVSTTGDDTSGDGSSSSPLKTIKKAVEETAKGFFTWIVLGEGEHLITEDIEYEGKKMYITQDAEDDTKIIHTTDENNRVHAFVHYENTFLAFRVKKIEIQAPKDTGIGWDSMSACHRVVSGVSVIDVRSFYTGPGEDVAVEFSDVAATGTSLPCFVAPQVSTYGTGIPILQITKGIIKTQENAYAVNSGGMAVHIYSPIEPVDNKEFVVSGGINNIQKFTTNDISAIINEIGNIIKDISGKWSSIDSFDNTSSDKILKQRISDVISQFTGVDIMDITVNVTTTRSLGVIKEISFELSGVENITLPIIFSSSTGNRLFMQTQAPKKNINVFTNIKGIN